MFGELITSGFKSSAEGSLHSYRTGIEDQLNIISSSMSNSGGRVDSDGIKVQLNPAQMNALRDDFVLFRESLLDEVDARFALIDGLTSEVEIQAIIDKAWWQKWTLKNILKKEKSYLLKGESIPEI